MISIYHNLSCILHTLHIQYTLRTLQPLYTGGGGGGGGGGEKKGGGGGGGGGEIAPNRDIVHHYRHAWA